jgi:cell fate (sporulation/competence/biofilm development) regulator YlbF (YheA/YmcA/DUF963 family)
MSANMYDAAYELEKAIRQSGEFQNLKKVYNELFQDETALRMFENFRNVQLRLQQKQMTGQEIFQEEIEHAQKTMALIQQHEKISQLMAAEERMSVLIGELNKIILHPLEELYESMEKTF